MSCMLPQRPLGVHCSCEGPVTSGPFVYGAGRPRVDRDGCRWRERGASRTWDQQRRRCGPAGGSAGGGPHLPRVGSRERPSTLRLRLLLAGDIRSSHHTIVITTARRTRMALPKQVGSRRLNVRPWRCALRDQQLGGVGPLWGLMAVTTSRRQLRRREAGWEGSWRRSCDVRYTNRI
jgi:hypothetical protein